MASASETLVLETLTAPETTATRAELLAQYNVIMRVYDMILALMTLVYTNVDNLPIPSMACEWTDDVVHNVSDIAKTSKNNVVTVPVDSKLFLEYGCILTVAIDECATKGVSEDVLETILEKFFQFKIDAELETLTAAQKELVLAEYIPCATDKLLFAKVVVAMILYEKLRVMHVRELFRVPSC
jgi:hypothetical protein